MEVMHTKNNGLKCQYHIGVDSHLVGICICSSICMELITRSAAEEIHFVHMSTTVVCKLCVSKCTYSHCDA